MHMIVSPPSNSCRWTTGGILTFNPIGPAELFYSAGYSSWRWQSDTQSHAALSSSNVISWYYLPESREIKNTNVSGTHRQEHPSINRCKVPCILFNSTFDCHLNILRRRKRRKFRNFCYRRHTRTMSIVIAYIKSNNSGERVTDRRDM